MGDLLFLWLMMNGGELGKLSRLINVNPFLKIAYRRVPVPPSVALACTSPATCSPYMYTYHHESSQHNTL